MHHIALLLPLAALLTAKVDRIARDGIREGPSAGLSIAVESRGRRVVSRGWGFANLELGVPATDRTLYRIGSVTKQFTAAAILRLMETGRLRLDQDVAELLPEFPTRGHHVTVEHLLTHTSGIFSYTSLGPDFWEKTTRLELTPREVLDLFKDRPFDFPPGEKWSYSNSGYHLLGMILEKLGGRPYAEVVRTEVLERAGLQRTMYCANEPILEGRAAGYSQKDGKLVNAPAIGMSIPFSAGGLCSTVGELIAWQRALESGKVVSAASYEKMITPITTRDGAPSGYGYGLGIGDLDGHRRISHGGGINGFNADLARYPDDDLTVVVLGNTDATLGLIAARVARAALGLPEPVVKDLPVPAEEAARMVGTYEVRGNRLVVFASDGRLRLRGPGDERGDELLYQGGGEFVVKGTPDHLRFDPQDARATLMRLGDGKRWRLQAARVE